MTGIATLSPDLLFASADASVRFAEACLEPVAEGRLRARSTFVDPGGAVMHWHDFGDLEGPGWAANAVGGAHLLYRWGAYTRDAALQNRALQLLAHVMEDGFIRDDGFVWPYYDLARGSFCLNYSHTNDWLCPGSLAQIGVQMLDFASELTGTPWEARLRDTAANLGNWLTAHVPLLPNGWVPRRITAQGDAYPNSPDGGQDPIFDHSADGLFLLDLYARLGYAESALRLGAAFVSAGGFWGSLNHDTYDDHENVAFAVAFGVLRRAADLLGRPEWREFAYASALPAMARFRMERDEHGVATAGLFWMEETWDTAYLWENAEVAQALLDTWLEQGDLEGRDIAVDVLSAIAHHHYGSSGFLSEGIDWNNHVSQRHHINHAYYGAIRYTEPLLNNLHLVGPTLTYLGAIGFEAGSSSAGAVVLPEGQCTPVVEGARYLLRLYHPVLETDDSVAAVIAFAHRAGVDGVLLFEASYDTDPALLPLSLLKQRFDRLRTLVPRFRAEGFEVHINVMITMGHVDDGGGHPEAFDFQFLVDEYGNTSHSTACPLAPAFLDYAGLIYRWAAECGADAVWVDDDVRFLWHDVPGMTCFCPQHLAALARRTGQRWTREPLVAALREGGDADLRRAWLAVQEEAMVGLARRVEQVVHGVDPAQPIGLMTVGTSVHNAEGRHTDRLLRTLAGPDARPMLRPGSGFWHDWEPGAILAKTEDVARQVAYVGGDVRAVAEIENHPYSPFAKSLRVLALEMALNVLAGTPDLSLNILSGSMPYREPGVDYPAFLREQRPFLDALADERTGKHRTGIGVEAREDLPPAPQGRELLSWVEPRPWELVLARLGFPVGDPYGAPHLFAGRTTHIDRQALSCSLQEGLILTPDALGGLLEQGCGARLGVRAVRPAPPDANELLTGDPWNGNYAGACLPVRHSGSHLHPYTVDLAPAAPARVLSRWRGVDGIDGGPATVALALPDGQRVALVPFEIQSASPALLQVERRAVWAQLFAWVAGGSLPVHITSGANVALQLFLSSSGEHALLAAVNLSADPAAVELGGSLPERVGAAERLLRAGAWTSEPDPWHVAVEPWSLTALRWRLV